MSVHDLRLFPPKMKRATAIFHVLLLWWLSLGVAVPAAEAQERQVRGPQGAASLRTRESGVRRVRRRFAGRSRLRGRFLSFQTTQALDGGEPEPELREERLDWFLLQRTYPSPYFNLPPRLRSEAQRDSFLREQSEAAFDGARPHWKPLGSAPIESYGSEMRPTTGRITAVAVSPADANVILVGAGTGGIWRSDDGGYNFKPVADKQEELAVGSIAFSKSDPLVVYAGMGDYTAGYMGTGVLKSTDGGQTWWKVSGDHFPLATISKVIVHPSDPNRLWLTEFKFLDPTSPTSLPGGVRLSTNGGGRWSERTVQGLPLDLALHPGDPDTLYAAVTHRRHKPTEKAAILKSVDGGRRWRAIFVPAKANRPDHRFSFKIGTTPAAPNNVYVLVTHIVQRRDSQDISTTLMISEDAGANWKSVNVPKEGVINIGIEFLAVDPGDPATLYVGTGDLFKSTDGGHTWVNLMGNWIFDSTNGSLHFRPEVASSHTDQRAFVFSPADPKVFYVGNDGGLWHAVNGGLPAGGRRAFEPRNSLLPVAQFWNIAAHPSDVRTVYGGTQDNGTLILTGSTEVWRELITGDGGSCVLDLNDPGIVYVNFYYGSIGRFGNGQPREGVNVAGNNDFGEPEQGPRMAFFPPFISDPTTGRYYFGTHRLFVSTDADNWTEVSPKQVLTNNRPTPGFGPDVLSVIAVSPLRGDVIYTGSAQGRVMTTRDGGRRWHNVTGTLPKRFIKSITVDPEDPAIAYLTVSGFGEKHVFKTVDGGARWTDISGDLPNAPANALLIDPLDKNVIYVGTDAGVFRSSSNGLKWQSLNNGLPPVIVTDFAVRADKTILVATYGRGAFELVR